VSENPTLVTARHFEYVAARTRGDDDFLRDLKSAARDAGIPAIWISPAQASFMQIQLRLCAARTVIEVGTLAGYSAIWMARALPAGGRVHTIELETKHADFARTLDRPVDVADRVVVHRGAGQDVLPQFDAGSADAAFLDADKGGYPTYLRECLRILRPGGLIMVDNAFAFGSSSTTSRPTAKSERCAPSTTSWRARPVCRRPGADRRWLVGGGQELMPDKAHAISTHATIRHLEKLAPCGLEDDERESAARPAGAHLGYVQQLEAIDVDGDPPTSQVIESTNVQRPDVVEASLPVETVLANAADRSGPFYRVPRFHGESEPPS
jgi:aspartyl/glutamyl-tRNA(Asn/Gln) amidotransferase C subunit